jgi:membrane protein
VADPSLGDLSKHDYMAIFVRAAKKSIKDHIPNLAAALAYYAFLAIPSLLLISVGVFGLVADKDAVGKLVDRMETVAPPEALTLVRQSLERITQGQASSGIAMVVVGSVLALWTLTGSMQTLMWALNSAYDREETRGFVKQRLTALLMVILILVAFVLAFGLLVLGPHLSGWVGSAVNLETLVKWLWWTAQWPILIVVLLFAFAVVLALGPALDEPSRIRVSAGSAVALGVWLAASGGLAVYSASFGSFEKTWGTLSAVVVTLVWLWLGGAALLLGAEIDAASRTLRERPSPT